MMKQPEKTKKSVNQSLICSPLFFVYLIATKCLNVDEKKKGSQSQKENEYVHWSRNRERGREKKTDKQSDLLPVDFLMPFFLSRSLSYPFPDLFLFFLSLYACPICL